jgi:hypothetical protein
MSSKAQAKLAIVRQLIERASDSVVRSLEQALVSSSGGPYNAATEALCEMIAQERRIRRTQSVVFAPVIAPFVRRPRMLPTLQYPPETLKVLWRELKELQGPLLERAVAAVAADASGHESYVVFDEVCAAAATVLDTGEAPNAVALVANLPGGVAQLSQLLRLAPSLRGVIPRLDGWLRNLNGDNVASVRLAFKDSAVICDDGGLLMMEILCAQLQEPWQILRLISAVMDHPADSFVAISELAPFGERIMADVGARIDALKRFDPVQGPEAGRAAAVSIAIAVQEIGEFEQWFKLSRDSVWGKRIFEMKRNLAAGVEARLKEVEPSVAQALPLATKPFGGKSLRAPAKLVEDPSTAAVFKADGLLAFMDGVRSSASAGGYGSYRIKVMEALDERLDHYTEDLIDRLLTDAGRGGPPVERVRAYLEIAARFVAQVRDPKAADIIRRRSASAQAA